MGKRRTSHAVRHATRVDVGVVLGGCPCGKSGGGGGVGGEGGGLWLDGC